MLLDEFQCYLARAECECHHEQAHFDDFYAQRMHGHKAGDLLKDLAYQIYQLQVCVEGLLQDREDYGE